MKNIANYISISRIVMSIVLLAMKVLTIPFGVIYMYCGISDMLDGYIARKNKCTSEFGERLDSVADIVFIIVSMIKILPILDLSNVIIIWIIIIALIKIYNIISTYIICKKLVLPHTIVNKITGLILFILPLIMLNNNVILLEIIVCIIATVSAIQECFYNRKKLQEKINKI